MTEPAGAADSPRQEPDSTPALLGIACGAGAALCWAFGFAATRHGLKAGLTPADLLMHRYFWSGLAFLPLVLRGGLGNLLGIGWARGLALMVLGGPVFAVISYAGFQFVPLGHGSVIQPSCATLGGLFLAVVLLRERVTPSRLTGAVVIVGGLVIIGAEFDRTYRRGRRAGRPDLRVDRLHVCKLWRAAPPLARVGAVGGGSDQRALPVAAAGLYRIRRHQSSRRRGSAREPVAGDGAGHPGGTGGALPLCGLDPVPRRRPRRGLPRDGAGVDAPDRLASAWRAADCVAVRGPRHRAARLLPRAAAAQLRARLRWPARPAVRTPRARRGR